MRIIIGDGSEKAALEAKANQNITFLGRADFETLKGHYRRCKALIFPGVEDFGIVPLEATASGRPVIALAQGGARETVRPGVTGVWFDHATTDALNAAIETCETELLPKLDPSALAEHVATYSQDRFRTEFKAIVDKTIAAHTITGMGNS